MTHWTPYVFYLLIPTLLALAACSDNAGEREKMPSNDEAPASDEASGELTTLAYNVAGLPQEVSQVNPQKHIPLISPLLNDYDIVLTQEDFDWWQPALDQLDFANYHARLRAKVDHPYQSERHPGPEAVGIDVATERPMLQVGDGLGILSRFPFDEFRRVPWETCGEGAADCLAMKGFAMARVELASGLNVDVYNLHADAGSEDSDIAARAAGFMQLAAYIQEHSAGHAVIIGGDTNLHSDSRSDDPLDREDARVWETFLAQARLVDVCDALNCEDPTRIDKFAFTSGGGIDLEPLAWKFEVERFRDADGEPLSDHDPLAVRWRWSATRD
jgi:endonuclease/exonuclease/phosphatase (EEP) superfamily protein YafD